MSNTDNRSPRSRGMLSRKRPMVSYDTGDLRASEPKHTALVFRARDCNSEVNGILSHATFSFMSYCGTPAPSRLTATDPVGYDTRATDRPIRPASSMCRMLSPGSSEPTALTTVPLSPNELAYMVCEISRCATGLPAFGKHVPEQFADTDDHIRFFH